MDHPQELKADGSHFSHSQHTHTGSHTSTCTGLQIRFRAFAAVAVRDDEHCVGGAGVGGNTLPAAPVPASPASLLWDLVKGGGGEGARYLLHCVCEPTLFRNAAAGPLEFHRRALKCDKLGETSGRTFIWLAQGRWAARTGPD